MKPCRGLLHRAALILFILALGCCSDSSKRSIIGPTVAFVAVSPTSGPPGTVLHMDSWGPDIDISTVRVTIGGEPAPALLNGEGRLVTIIPLFPDTDGMPAPPAVPVELEIFEGQVLVARGETPITVTSFPEQHGALDQVLADLNRALPAFAQFLETAFPSPCTGEQYAYAVLVACDSLLHGSQAMTLGGALSGQTSDSLTVRLLDGLYAASGFDQAVRLFADAITGLALSLPPAAQRSEAEISLLSDTQLAYLMQLRVVLDQFGQQVIAQTGTEFAIIVGTTASISAIGGMPVPQVAVTQLILAYLDLILNKIALGFLPAHLDAVNLSLAADSLLQGDVTDAMITLNASNERSPITLQYMVGTILTVLGVMGDSSAAATIREVLEEIAVFVTGLMQTAVSNYASLYPELNLDIEMGSLVPALSWEADAVDTRLTACMSRNESLISALDHELNWMAADDDEGTTQLYAWPAAGAEARLLPTVMGIEYTGGAFGEDMTQSEWRAVTVLPLIELELNFPPSIVAGGAGVLDVRAGRRTDIHTVEYTTGIDFAITVLGGTAEQSIGSTDQEGRFMTVVHADQEGAEEIVITVLASGDGGAWSEKELHVSIQGGSCVGYVHLSAIAVDCFGCSCGDGSGSGRYIVEVCHSCPTLEVPRDYIVLQQYQEGIGWGETFGIDLDESGCGNTYINMSCYANYPDYTDVLTVSVICPLQGVEFDYTNPETYCTLTDTLRVAIDAPQ